MKKYLLILIISLFIIQFSFPVCYSGVNDPESINDGPYIFKTKNKLKVMWIEKNVLREDYITPENYIGFKNKFNLMCSYKDLDDTFWLKPNYNQIYSNIDSIGVISDIHGEYNIYIRLLKANGIIDDNLNWKFGRGHLVVLGDIFDRGEMVTEVFWHLFGLEKQAETAGGMVHVMLGNHETMVLSNDLSYINEKYKKVEIISGNKYNDLYSDDSVLGRWLRSKPVIISLNDILFIHAGISIELARRNLKIKQINQMFLDEIVGKSLQSIDKKEELKLLNEDYGPLWYRGYFADTAFCVNTLDSILDFYAKEHIIVGHTSFKDIIPLFNNKIIDVDAGIMNEQPGEMLIYKNGAFYKGFITGKRIRL
jgi:hypothetical protein